MKKPPKKKNLLMEFIDFFRHFKYAYFEPEEGEVYPILQRDEKKFESVDQLAKQITKDCIMAKGWHRKNSA